MPSPRCSSLRVVQILGQPERARAVWILVGLAVFPFVYELLVERRLTTVHSCTRFTPGGFSSRSAGRR